MFNNKKKEIAELYAKLRDVDAEIARLHVEAEEREEYITNLTEHLDRMESALEHTPNDCKVGEWCHACEFGKAYTIGTRNGFLVRTIYLCDKASACQNFVQRGKAND